MTRHILPTALRARAEVLAWQNRLRLFVSTGVAIPYAILRISGPLPPMRPGRLAITFTAYQVIIWLLGRAVRHEPERVRWALPAVMVADAAAIGSLLWIAAIPNHLPAVLILSFATLLLTEYHFGWGWALVSLGLTIMTYIALIAASVHAGMPVMWAQEIWLLFLYALVVMLFLAMHGAHAHRLDILVGILNRAREGDLDHRYPVERDPRPDAITLLGGAFNEMSAQLATLVVRDALTGCLNRRGLSQALARELARASRTGEPVTLVEIDIDHFKRINDAYGHLAGDTVLVEAGRMLRALTRHEDSVARSGGEEFTVVLPRTGAVEGLAFAERLCVAFRDQSLLVDGRLLSITVSGGVVTTLDALAVDERLLRSRADEALYAAKRGGRNRVVAATTIIGRREERARAG